MKQTIIALLVGVALYGCAAQDSSFSTSPLAIDPHGTSPWTVRGHIPLNEFVIHSHRGAGDLVPENTLTAFEMGWKLGTVPEADMRTTKDGILVAFHDANFKRTVHTNDAELKKKSVGDLTFAELSQLDVGGWKGPAFEGLRVPKLSEVFQAMRGHPERQLCLDFKHVDLRQLAAEVHTYGVSRQIVFATTNYKILREWKALLPDSETLLWLAGSDDKVEPRLAELRASGFADITHLQLHPKANPKSDSAEPFTISRALIRSLGDEMRSHRILFMAFPREITDPKLYWQLLDLGVASFSTDDPEFALKAVREYYEQP
ncbi:MAG: glycerophosphodiester phosphodiesterase family protein [Phycisphaerae bacterium]|nr:glycerophosphodiester phosphodiesterase family protein [Phycisphaerae bacterium]